MIALDRAVLCRTRSAPPRGVSDQLRDLAADGGGRSIRVIVLLIEEGLARVSGTKKMGRWGSEPVSRRPRVLWLNIPRPTRWPKWPKSLVEVLRHYAHGYPYVVCLACDKRHTPSFADAKSAAVRVVADLGASTSPTSRPGHRAVARLPDRPGAKPTAWIPLWALRGAIQAAMLEGVIDHDPSRGLPARPSPKRVRPEYRAAELVLTASDVRALLEAAPSSRRTQWAVVLLAGPPRRRGLRAPGWGDVRPDEPLDCLVCLALMEHETPRDGADQDGAVGACLCTALAAMLRAHRATWLSALESRARMIIISRPARGPADGRACLARALES